MALIRMCVVPNCIQRLSQSLSCGLWLSVPLTGNTLLLCLLMVGLTHLRLPTHPRHSPPTRPPLLHAICDITVTVKKVSQKLAVLAS